MADQYDIIVNLANDRVPIAVIARGCEQPFGIIEGILRDAIQEGRIAALPRADWPGGVYKERDLTRALQSPRIMDASNGDDVFALQRLKKQFGLTPSEARITLLLAQAGACSNDRLLAHISSPVKPLPEPKVLDVFCCKANRKLRPFDISIDSIWGWGKEMKPDARNAVLKVAGLCVDDAASAPQSEVAA